MHGAAMKQYLFFVLALLMLALPLNAGPFIDLENGLVFTGLNDVRIPGKYGTRLSLPGVLDNDPSYFIRARAGWTIKDQHTISVLAAPLKIDYRGNPSGFIYFRNRLFFPYVPIKATFKFNSFRLTYRYDIVKNDKIEFGLGLTGKIRDAYVRFDSMGIKTTRPDLGFVPLINVRLQWMFVHDLSFLLDADWLAAPQGRAEDILFALQYHAGERVLIRAGYRILEGGADNKSVYTFSLFHYLTFGTTVMF
jgi:hypothetical protein